MTAVWFVLMVLAFWTLAWWVIARIERQTPDDGHDCADHGDYPGTGYMT